MEKYCISIDWLQVYCLRSDELEATNDYHYEGLHSRYKLVSECIETSMFRDVFKVFQESSGMCVAKMLLNPRSGKLNPRMCLVKLENRVLYSSQYIQVLYDIIGSLNLVYKGITRIDVCYDCIRYKGGRSPLRFINSFLSKSVDQVGYIYLNRIKEFTAHGSKDRTSSSKVTSIKFGSGKSRITSYIYDKSKELSEVKDKPWIRDFWEMNGIVPDEKHHVFRSEISIKAEGTDLLHMSTGELFKLSPWFLEHRDSIEKVFHYYAKKYFDFRINTGQKNTRYFENLELFECNVVCETIKPAHISKSADTGRMERICVNKLKRLAEEYSDLADYYRRPLEVAIRFISEVAGVKESIVKKQAESMYLASLRGKRWCSADVLAYLSCVDACHRLKEDVSSEALYHQFWDYGF